MAEEFEDFSKDPEFDQNEKSLKLEDVALFLRTFRLSFPQDVPGEDKTLVKAVLDLLDLASVRDLALEQAKSPLRPLLAPVRSPRNGTVFITGRENWVQRIDAPIFVGEDIGGVKQIRFRNNNDAGSRFNFELLEETSISEVSILENGQITAFLGKTIVNLRGVEKLELADYVFMAKSRLQRIIDLESKFQR